MTATPPKERRPPVGSAWRQMPAAPAVLAMPGVVEASCWSLREILVVSTLNEGELPRGGQGLAWHVSASTIGARRCNDRQMARVRRDFRMIEAEEDNHRSGVARNLFLLVDPAFRVACECKETEEQVTEPDGYRWSKSQDCPDCEIRQLVGAGPCLAHAPPDACCQLMAGFNQFCPVHGAPAPIDLLVMDSGIGVEQLNKASLDRHMDQYIHHSVTMPSGWPDLKALDQRPEKKP
jgi:hypothetical protein